MTGATLPQLPTSGPVALRARWIFPVDRPPLADGVVTLEGERIVAVGENVSGEPAHDLGEVALLPGLVNAHTHLEFSSLSRPLGKHRMPFADWIREVVAYRREQAAAEATWEAARREAVRAGLTESLRCGTTLVGEIATQPWPADPAASSDMQGVVFHELLGLSSERVEELVQHALACLGDRVADNAAIDAADNVERQAGDIPRGWTVGWSPHAPYTVHIELLERIVQLSAARCVPLAMHLAESLEEIELLASHSGPLLECLRDLNAWDASGIPRGITPTNYLELLAGSHRALIIHGNYLTSADHQLLARHRDRMSVVYCPRTHAWFGHARYALREMLEAGVRVALGTDSRASNPDLDLLAEMQFAAGRHPDVDLEVLLRLGTLDAAEALGRAELSGSIAPGKRADLLVVPLPSARSEQPSLDFLRDEKLCALGVICGGRVVARGG